MARVIFFVLILNLSLGCAASEKIPKNKLMGNVPKEIYQLMKKKECSPIREFYNREISLPPFVYISNLFDSGTMIFFVCEMDNPVAEDKYKIVLTKKQFTENGARYVDFQDCPSEIYYRNMPGGLAVRLIDELSSLDYNLWKDTKNYKWSDRELPLIRIDKPSPL